VRTVFSVNFGQDNRICQYHSGSSYNSLSELLVKISPNPQLGALGLVTNAVVLWNTIYMDAARNYLKQKSVLIREEDEARLSPLQYGHINVLGHYSFVLSEKIMQGKLRPFNKLADNIDVP